MDALFIYFCGCSIGICRACLCGVWKWPSFGAGNVDLLLVGVIFRTHSPPVSQAVADDLEGMVLNGVRYATRHLLSSIPFFFSSCCCCCCCCWRSETEMSPVTSPLRTAVWAHQQELTVYILIKTKATLTLEEFSRRFSLKQGDTHYQKGGVGNIH